MKKYSKETTVGIFVFLGFALIVFMSINLGDMRVFSDSHYPLTARFNDVSGLRINAPVEMMGVQVGYVENISLDAKNMKAVVVLKLKNEIKLTDDAIASVKTSGLIGDKYIKITPGGVGDPLNPGDTLIETESAIDLEELISKYVFGKV